MQWQYVLFPPYLTQVVACFTNFHIYLKHTHWNIFHVPWRRLPHPFSYCQWTFHCMAVHHLFKLTPTDELWVCFQLFVITNIAATNNLEHTNLDISSTINSPVESKQAQTPQPCTVNKPHLFYWSSASPHSQKYHYRISRHLKPKNCGNLLSFMLSNESHRLKKEKWFNPYLSPWQYYKMWV